MSTAETLENKRIFGNRGNLSKHRTPMSKVFQDISTTAFSWRIWMSMGWQDVKLRYKRTKLGPFWITITTFVFIAAISFIFGNLLNSNRASYLPHLASGYVAWTFISAILSESCESFNSSQRYILQMNLPYTLYVMRMVFKNSITLLHNILPVIVISVWKGYEYSPLNIIVFLFSFFLLALWGLFIGTVFACVGTRFRDIRPGLQSIVRVCFFCTPIMWTRERFPEKYQYIIDYNPFYHLVEMLRRPLLGEYFSLINLYVTLGLVLSGFVLMIIVLRRTRHRIAFWV